MEPEFTQDELVRQIQLHLQSLRQAGVDWLPKPTGEVLQPPAIAPKPTGEVLRTRGVEPPAASTKLFEIPTENAAADVMSLDERRQALKVLAAEVSKCTRCPELCSRRTQTVFSWGEPGVELCFVGEAPGADEDAQGVPFVGAAGQLLNKILEASGFKREEVYICNILKCQPPGNRTPLANEAANCREYLDKQLRLVKPKYICALGGCAATNLLGTTLSIGKLRGRFHDYQGIPVLVTYHPAYLLPHKHPEMKREVWADMQFLVTAMGRELPKR